METREALDIRLRSDLQTLMKTRDRFGARVVRSVLTAIDNACAVPLTADDAPTRDFSGERPRREVTIEEMYTILESQISEREEAIAVFAEHGAEDRADSLRMGVKLLAGYRAACSDG